MSHRQYKNERTKNGKQKNYNVKETAPIQTHIHKIIKSNTIRIKLMMGSAKEGRANVNIM